MTDTLNSPPGETSAWHVADFRATTEVDLKAGLEADLEFDHAVVWLSLGNPSTGYTAGSRLHPDEETAVLAVDYLWEEADMTVTDRVLELDLPAPVARDVELHAALVLAAVRVHSQRRGHTW